MDLIGWKLLRDSQGRFVKEVKEAPDQEVYKLTKVKSSEKPLVSFRIESPVTYFKAFWRRFVANEGVDFHFRIHPLTALAITAIIVSGSFGLGFLARTPIAPYLPLAQTSPPQPSVLLDTAFSGTLRKSLATQKYYLLTRDSQAINLEVPANVNLKNLVGKRIFAEGSFNKETQTLKIADAREMEILPTAVTPVPTIATFSSTPPLILRSE